MSRTFSPVERRHGEPKGKENGGVGGGSCPHGDGRKVEFSSPTLGSGLPCPSICTLRRDPWGSEASRALHRHRGGPILKMLPLSLRAEVLHSLAGVAAMNSAQIWHTMFLRDYRFAVERNAMLCFLGAR